MTSIRLGMYEIDADASVTTDGSTANVDFGGRPAPVACSINGHRMEARDPATLAELINAHAAEASRMPLWLPRAATADDTQVCIAFDPSLAATEPDLALTGSAADRALAKAARLIERGAAWTEPNEPGVAAELDRLNSGWGGPLIVSMPRTGSTLFGTLFLMASDPLGSDQLVFARYLHEPVAPIFWQGRGPDATAEIVDPHLTDRDIVQESAYQFTTAEIAGWFLEHARAPVVFLVRHPQRAWPSRWRVMLRMMRADEARRADWERIDAALDDTDFSNVGDLLTGRVRPPDNGWFAFLAAVEHCRDRGIDHVIIDNTRFRNHPGEILREVSRRWSIPYDERLTTWQTLDTVQDRVVMGEMARTAEYEWYYARTMGSRYGIIRADDDLLEAARFPRELRGETADGLSIDEAVTWYRALLTRPEVLD